MKEMMPIGQLRLSTTNHKSKYIVVANKISWNYFDCFSNIAEIRDDC